MVVPDVFKQNSDVLVAMSTCAHVHLQQQHQVVQTNSHVVEHRRSLQREAQHIGHFVGIDKDDWMCSSVLIVFFVILEFWGRFYFLINQ